MITAMESILGNAQRFSFNGLKLRSITARSKNVLFRWLGRFLALLVFSPFCLSSPEQSVLSMKKEIVKKSIDQASMGFDAFGYFISYEVAAIALTAVVALLAALFTIRSTRDIERRRNAISTVMEARRDSTLQDAMIKMREIDSNERTSIEIYYYKTCKDKEGRSLILYLLNHYENIAVGVNNSIFDEDIIKRAEFNIICNVKEMCWPFINKIRSAEKKDTYFKELTDLVARWEKKPLTGRLAGRLRF